MKTSKTLLMRRFSENHEWETVLTFNDNEYALAFRHLDQHNKLFPESQHKLVAEFVERIDINPAIARPKYNPAFYGDVE